MNEEINFPLIKSPDGEVYRCILFATKTPPGLEWYGFEVHKEDDHDTIYYGLVDTHRRELAYFSLRDLEKLEADLTRDPRIISEITLPYGWKKFKKV